ncbi:MAG: glycosyltransferase family 9 protein, partial [bacterium]|nr:glycosyltransferase family 9 protein [bacterium]
MNVLIVRTSAMGDIVHALPVLSALRRGLPGARIGWVVERAFAPLLEAHPDLDEVIPVRLRAWRKNLLSGRVRGEIGTAHAALRRFAPDVTLDLMGNHKGGAIARLSGARRIIGPARRHRREPSSAVWINEPVDVGGEHAVDRTLAVLAPLGPEAGPVEFGGDKIMPRPPAAAEAFLAARRRPFVLIQAGAGWGNKSYPPAWWGEVARRLAEATGFEVWVPIAPGEEDLAHGVVAASGGTARAVDAASLELLAALMRGSRLLLGGDTGPLHLAHALGTPVLCVMGPTDPSRNGPYGAVDLALWRHLPCSFCYKRLAGAKACLLAISP